MSDKQGQLDTHCYECGRENDSQTQALIDKHGGGTDEYEAAVATLDKEREASGELDFKKGCELCGR